MTESETAIQLLNEIRQDLTPVLAIQSPMQLSGHRKQNKEVIRDLLIVEIMRLSNALHTSRSLAPHEIADIAEDILKDYWMLKFEEIVLILEKVRKSKNYNKLDESVIFSFIDEYIEKERQSLIDKARIEERKQQEVENKEQEAMIRQLYEDVKAGKRKLYIEQLNEQNKEEKRKKQSDSKKEAEYVLWREQYLKEQKAKNQEETT